MPDLSWSRTGITDRVTTHEEGHLTSAEVLKTLDVYYGRTAIRVSIDEGFVCSAVKRFDIADGKKASLGMAIRLKPAKPTRLGIHRIGRTLFVWAGYQEEPSVLTLDMNGKEECLEVYFNKDYVTNYRKR